MNMKVPAVGASNQELLSAIEVMLDTKLDAKIGALDKKLDAKLDTKLGILDAKIDVLDAKLDSKIGALDAKLDSKIGALDAKLDSKIGALDAKIDSTHVEVLEVIHELSRHTDERFIALEHEQIRMRAVMVTKDYLDDKLSDLRSSIIRHTQREIEKAKN
jgi:hypothetical protein